MMDENTKTVDNKGVPEPAVEERYTDDASIGNANGPIGLDIGTTSIIAAQLNGKSIKTARELNAFYPVPDSKIIKRTLVKDNVNYFDKDGHFYIIGNPAENFATLNGSDTRRPVASGLLNPDEDEGIEVLKKIINSMIKKAQKKDEVICFCVPGNPIDNSVSTVFHESVIKMHLKSLGYMPIAVNEGHAVVLSELAGNSLTGIGISIGGGMCNVCFSYLSVPVITFSIQKGGDYIDTMVSKAVGESATNIKRIKEEDLDQLIAPRNKVETGLHIFYDDLFSTLLQAMQKVFGATDKVPKISSDLPLVLSGGSIIPRGCKEKFEDALKQVSLPIKISDIVVAEKPLYTTAKGSMQMAMEEGKL
jgi:actin-like ATPase involved in cell morphogenesis